MQCDLRARHRQRRSLRRTGVMRIAEAGAIVPQIAAIAGWTVDYNQRIVNTHLLHRTDVTLARFAVWERRTSIHPRVKRLADGRRN